MDFSKFQSEIFSRKDFEFLKSLGHSKTYSVHQARSIKQDQDFAIKVISKSHLDSPEKYQELISEKETLERLSHPGIIKLLGTFTDTENIYMILEYCENLDLASFISKFEVFPYELVRFYSSQLVSAVSYLISSRVSHGSLSPKNVLLTRDRHIKLTDFRNTHQLRPSVMYQDKPDYVAPELLQGQSSGTAADLWSLGCIVFELLVGVSPFKASTTEATISRIKSGNVEFSLNITPLAVDFIQSLLLCDPNLRMGVDDAEELTSHIFLQGVIFSRIFSAPAPDYSVEMKKIAPVAEKVVKEEVVKKKCGWIYKKRILRLCDTPCLKYFDPAKGECRGIIEVNPQIKVEVKGKSEFVITIPKRSYFFKDLSNNAEDWKNLISNQINRVYGKY